MAKGITQILPEEKVQQGIFDKLPDREYFVTGFGKFITTDEATGLPCFVPQNGSLVTRFELRCGDGSIGPAASASPAEFWMLIETFGGEVKGIPATQRTSGEAMNRAVESANSNSVGFSIKSEGGWANGLRKVIRPPRARYTVQLTDVRRPDRDPGNLHFQEVENKWDKEKKPQFQLVFEFEIVGGPHGKPTLYDGFKLFQYMNNPFTDEYKDLNGTVHNAVLEGRFLWGHTEKGGIVSYAPAWHIFMEYFCDLNDYEWIVDASQSQFGVSEVLEPQYVVVNNALKNKKKVIIYWQPKQKGENWHFKWDDLPADNELQDINLDEEEKQPAQLGDLIDYITKKWSDVQIFDQSASNDNAVVFTEIGKTWAKEYMSAPWTKAGMSLENRKPLHELDATEVERLYSAFKQIYGELEQPSGW